MKVPLFLTAFAIPSNNSSRSSLVAPAASNSSAVNEPRSTVENENTILSSSTKEIVLLLQ